MKNHLNNLKDLLIKKKEIKLENIQNNEDEKNNNKIVEFMELINLKYAKMELEKIKEKKLNAFKLKNKMIIFYPPNDGMPTCPFEFYQNNKLIIDNRSAFSQITNLDEILLKMIDVVDKGLDNDILIDSYNFMIELRGEIKKNYLGPANLIITDKVLRNNDIKEEDYYGARKYFINTFLDHFMGWNFGVSINRCSQLKEKLEELNNKVIEMGIRENAGPLFEVYGNDKEVYNGLQHYYLPISKEKKLVK